MSRIAYLIVGCLMVVAAHAAMAAENDLVHRISVTGKAERMVVPDQARININISAFDKKLEVAKAAHDKKLSLAMDIAKHAGIDEAQLKSQNFTIQPQYEYVKTPTAVLDSAKSKNIKLPVVIPEYESKQQLKGYVVATRVTITVKKIEATADLIEKYATSGLEKDSGEQAWNGLLSVSYTVADPDKIRNELLVEALKDAEEQAQVMAEALGATVGKPIQISQGFAPQFNFAPQSLAMMEPPSLPVSSGISSISAPMAAAPKMNIAPPVGEQQVNANASVLFELK